MEIREEAFAAKPISARVVDAHTHVFGANFNYGWYSAEATEVEIMELLDHLGIDCVVTAPLDLVTDVDRANETAATKASERPGRIYGYISVRPQQGIDGIRSTIEKYSGNKSFVGFKLLPGYHGPLACPEYDYVLDFACEAGCPVLSHIWGNNPLMTDVRKAAEKRNDLKLIMAHQGGGRTADTDAYVEVMKDYPNLRMDICGSLHNQYSMEDYVRLAGEDRIIYGSDMPLLDLRFDLCQVTLSTLSDSIKKKILAENFLKLLNGSQLGHIHLDN